MIAEIQPSFASHTALSRKVEYHMGKIDEGNARVLYTSTGSDLASFPGDMRLVSQLNDRVKLPYSEITLSLYPGENLTDEQWLSLSHEYLREMGYEHACYAVILNSDKAHSHVHILTTTIDETASVYRHPTTMPGRRRFPGRWRSPTVSDRWILRMAGEPPLAKINTDSTISTKRS